jgi:hypothetical protein
MSSDGRFLIRAEMSSFLLKILFHVRRKSVHVLNASPLKRLSSIDMIDDCLGE